MPSDPSSETEIVNGTTRPPTLDSLKLHADQAQRLRTQELQENVGGLSLRNEL